VGGGKKERKPRLFIRFVLVVFVVSAAGSERRRPLVSELEIRLNCGLVGATGYSHSPSKKRQKKKQKS